MSGLKSWAVAWIQGRVRAVRLAHIQVQSTTEASLLRSALRPSVAWWEHTVPGLAWSIFVDEELRQQPSASQSKISVKRSSANKAG